MNKIFKHLKTINKHKKEVGKLCFKCGIYWQGITHDLSKYSPAEFIPSVKYWTGTYSPIDEEIKEKGYSMAWLHHKGHNKHHFEYWTDYEHRDDPVPMPNKYVVEMFCDRVGACKTYLGDKMTNKAPLDYFHSHLLDREKAIINPETYKTLEFLLTIYAFQGEEYACEECKKMLKS